MVLGAALLISALLLFLYNVRENMRAEREARAVLEKLSRMISVQTDEENDEHRNRYDEESYEMTTKEIDGYDYIGYLSIPSLELELPVMSEWDYKRLRIAPCRQCGSTKSNNLVIAGHNYSRHFGSLSKLLIGTLVQFTDMDGEVRYYLVDAVETISPYAAEKVKNSDWELVLYTCTYGGQKRVMVGCREVTENER